MDDVQEVLVAAERRADALARRDAAALRSLHHPELRWTTHTGAVLDRDAYVRGNTEGELRWERQLLEEPRVTVVADVAILNAMVVDEVYEGGAPARKRLRLTQVWVRAEDGWVCLAGHAGPPVPPAAP